MPTITLTQTFPVLPKTFYSTFLDSKKHSEFTGAKASLGQKVGDNFSVWNGYATGKNLKLETNKKIVQSWRADDWAKDKISTLTIELIEQDGSTLMNFTQENVPEKYLEDIKIGWLDYYWKPLQKYFLFHK